MVRNRGTIGGSISNNDPAADYPSAVVGLAQQFTQTNARSPETISSPECSDGAGRRRTRYKGQLPHSGKSRLYEIPKPGIALCRSRHFRQLGPQGTRVAVTGEVHVVPPVRNGNCSYSELRAESLKVSNRTTPTRTATFTPVRNTALTSSPS